MSNPHLRAVNLTKTYHVNELVWAVRNLHLDVYPGDFVVLTGPSGSGKSTLLHLLAGLDRPLYGDVVLAGQRYSQLDEDGLARLRRRRIEDRHHGRIAARRPVIVVDDPADRGQDLVHRGLILRRLWLAHEYRPRLIMVANH